MDMHNLVVLKRFSPRARLGTASTSGTREAAGQQAGFSQNQPEFFLLRPRHIDKPVGEQRTFYSKS